MYIIRLYVCIIYDVLEESKVNLMRGLHLYTVMGDKNAQKRRPKYFGYGMYIL